MAPSRSLERISRETPIRHSILLFPNFPMMAFASVIEPLRAANVIAGRKLYSWSVVGLNDQPILASSGFAITPDHSVDQAPSPDRIVVCSGGDAERLTSAGAVRWIRRALRNGAALGAVADAAFFLAGAGLLDGYRCTLHWTSQPAFVEAFPQIELQRSLFVIDRSRFTALGGIGAFDMMLALIEKDFDATLALAVADWFAHSPLRSPLDRSSMPLRLRSGIRDQLVLSAVARMEEEDQEPSVIAMASALKVSPDTLERAFRAELGETPARHWRKLRLRRARDLLAHSELPVHEVALSCGYANASAFSRAFRLLFGHSPGDIRHGR